MSTCRECTSAHMPSGHTWNLRNMYKPSNFNPFLVSRNIPYGPPGCVESGYILPPMKENYYASGTTSWTTCGNVTPANSPTYGTQPVPIKESCCGATPFKHSKDTWVEGFCCGSSPYMHSSKTWELQKPYTS